MMVQFVKAKLSEGLNETGHDADSDMTISKFAFEALLLNPRTARLLQEVGVDVVGLVDFSDYLFKGEDETLSFTDFMELVLQLRGTNTATVKDIVDLRKFTSTEIRDTLERMNEMVHHTLSQIVNGLPDTSANPFGKPIAAIPYDPSAHLDFGTIMSLKSDVRNGLVVRNPKRDAWTRPASGLRNPAATPVVNAIAVRGQPGVDPRRVRNASPGTIPQSALARPLPAFPQHMWTAEDDKPNVESGK